MRGALVLAGRLLAGGRRRALLDLGLTAATVAVAVTVTLLVLGGIHGLDVRSARTDWREPVATEQGGSLVLQRTAEAFDGRKVDVLRVHDLGGDVTLPAGVARLPSDGEVLVSPELAELIAGPDGELLLPRLGRAVVGELGTESLAYADELVAVTGDAGLQVTPPDELRTFDHRDAGAFVPSDVLSTSGFATTDTNPDPTYRLLFGMAGALLLAPSVLLLGAAARLTAARRAQRLAGLRLVGATPGQTTLVATVETLAGAGAGVIGGLVLTVLARPVVTLVPLAGGRFAPADVNPGLLVTLLVVAVGLLLACVATLSGLRRVRTSPLGVVQVVTQRRPRAVRLLVVVALWAGFVAAVYSVRDGGATLPLVLGLAAVVGSISVGGPWVVWIVGAVAARLARRPVGLLAARHLSANPIAGFRPSTGLVLTAFVAGFVLVTGATSAALGGSLTGTPGSLALPAGATTSQVETALGDAGLQAKIGEAADRIGEPQVSVMPDDPAELEAVRTALDTLADPEVPITPADDFAESTLVLDDVGRGLALVLALALVQAAVATATGAAAAILEQAPTFAALRLAGLGVGRMLRVRLAEGALATGLLAVVTTGGGAFAGSLIIVATLGPRGIEAVLPALGGPVLVVVGALAAVALGTVATLPLLRSVTARPLAER